VEDNAGPYRSCQVEVELSGLGVGGRVVARVALDVDGPGEVGEKDLLAVDPPLRDVMRRADRHHASDTVHGVICAEKGSGAP